VFPPPLLDNVNGFPLTLTFAVPDIVTVPLRIVNWFPVTIILAVPEALTVPVAIINGEPVKAVLAVDEIVTVPVPKYKRSAPEVSTIEVAAIPTGPIVNSKLLPDTAILTLLSSPTVEKGNLANVSNPKSIISIVERDGMWRSLSNINYISL
jgi:hypothetical protein